METTEYQEDIVVGIYRDTRNYDIDRLIEKEGENLVIDSKELKKIYYMVEVAILKSIGDIIETVPYVGSKEAASTIANRALHEYIKIRNLKPE